MTPNKYRPGYYEYRGGANIAAKIHTLTAGNEFYSLIEAAMRFADSDNMELLREAFPNVYDDLRARYNAPGGYLPGEEGTR